MPFSVFADRLVILHTNDTHSQIEPDDKDRLGGVARRKVVVDSVRAAQKNVLLIDAGDAVQGSLFFNLYGGELEQKLMNALGYDLRILGNHEFDNGADSLASILAHDQSKLLATNYRLSGPLKNLFQKYEIRTFGDRRIGFIGINLAPKGMISEGNSRGVDYVDAIEAANASAWWLKNVENCDLVVVISHIGYNPGMPPGDIHLARNSSDIDIIIGAHSHDLIDPALGEKHLEWRIANRDGRGVLVTQAGKGGKRIGEITVDLSNLSTDYRTIQIDSRLDRRVTPEIPALIAPYRAGVDSLMRTPVGYTLKELPQGSTELLNWVSDVVYACGSLLAPEVDFAIVNKGGIRRGLPKGQFTEGQIMTMMPFNNRVQVIDIKGAELMEAFKQMAIVGGNGISEHVKIIYSADSDDDHDVEIEEVTINGKPFDLERTYRVATIDYLANGGDYMPSLRNHVTIALSPEIEHTDVLDYIRSLKGKKRRINPSSAVRFIKKTD